MTTYTFKDQAKNYCRRESLLSGEVAQVLISNKVAKNNSIHQEGMYRKALQLTPREIKTMKEKIIDGQFQGWECLLNYLDRQINDTDKVMLEMLRDYHFIKGTLEQAVIAAKYENFIKEQLPCVVTPAQYKADITAFSKKMGKIKLTPFDVYLFLLDSYVDRYKTNPKSQTAFNRIMREYKEQPITAPHILQYYNVVNKIGYNVFPNGKHSTELSQWECIKELMACVSIQKLPMAAKMAIQRPLLMGIKEIQTKSIFREFANDPKDIQEALKATGIKWEINPEPPKGITKADVLLSGKLFDYYPVIQESVRTDRENATEQSTAVKAWNEIKEEFNTAFTYIQLTVSDKKEFSHIATLSSKEEMGYPMATYSRLIKTGIIKDTLGATNTAARFAEIIANKRNSHQNRKNGLAVLATETALDNITEKGFYEPPDPNFYTGSFSSIISQNEEKAQDLRAANYRLRHAILLLLAYKTSDRLFSKIFQNEDIKELYPQTRTIYYLVETLNRLYDSVKHLWLGQNPGKEILFFKLSLHVYRPIILDLYEPQNYDPDVLEDIATDEEIKRMFYLKNSDIALEIIGGMNGITEEERQQKIMKQETEINRARAEGAQQ